MVLRQRLTGMGKLGVALFLVGPVMSIGTRQWLVSYLESLRGTGLTSVPDVSLYHAVIVAGAIATLISVPLMLLGREYVSQT
ncbi:hypothetical protein [Brucella cytisi]|uniref:Uncharacterized protein n=1 Tax=Brucella cytisi TaxID=407152 RepID=A0A1J6HZ71_9HYPH|nr:hypothetical protein [Brucella cytisi]OIS91930.1 hypothetical protein BLA27_18615 [Brucella cytisi]